MKREPDRSPHEPPGIPRLPSWEGRQGRNRRLPTYPTAPTTEPLPFGHHHRRLLTGVVVAGASVQVMLGLYYPSIVHSPKPRHLPIGIVGPARTATEIDAAV